MVEWCVDVYIFTGSASSVGKRFARPGTDISNLRPVRSQTSKTRATFNRLEQERNLSAALLIQGLPLRRLFVGIDLATPDSVHQGRRYATGVVLAFSPVRRSRCGASSTISTVCHRNQSQIFQNLGFLDYDVAPSPDAHVSVLHVACFGV